MKTISNELIRELEERIYKTYKCRMNASKRLERDDTIWSFSIVSMTAIVTLASVLSIQDPNEFGTFGNIYIIVCSIIVLIISQAISAKNLKFRSSLFQSNYIAIQKVSVDLENARNLSQIEPVGVEWFKAKSDEYQRLLAISENHKDRDYRRFQANENGKSEKSGNSIFSPNIVNLWWRVQELSPMLLPILLVFGFAWLFTQRS